MSEPIKYNNAVELFNAGRFKDAYCIWREMTDDKNAMFYAARLLIDHDDIVTEKRWGTAFALFKRASSLGNHEATYYCGYIREKVYGEKFYDEANSYYHDAFINEIPDAFEGIKRLAEKGVFLSQSCLGWYYRIGGHGVKENMSEAKKWSILANENGEKYKASENLGYIYEDEGDFEKALFYFKEAAANGNDNVFGQLGDIYRLGKVQKSNYSEAIKWYNMGAKAGDDDSRFFLGLMHLKGMGCKKNHEEAIKYFDMVVKSGNTERMCDIACEYYDCSNIIYDPRHAINLFEMSASKGHKRSSAFLGVLLYRGENIVQDYNRAFSLLSIGKDNSLAQEYLGLCYYFGNGCKKDEAIAKQYFIRSFENGNKSASKYLTNDMDLKPYSKWELEKDGAEMLGSAFSSIIGAILTGLSNND